MKTKMLAGLLGLLMTGMALPAMAYHIDGNSGMGPPNNAADWQILLDGFILCESEGPGDDRNPNAAGEISGEGGLCTTGENDATGLPCFPRVNPPPPAPPVKCAEPPATDWVRLDACSAITISRGGPGLPCAPAGSTAQHSWFAEIGAYSCFIPTDGAATTTPPTIFDHALYYRSLYAWWSYDGDGSYTNGDGIGAAHFGDGDKDNRNPVAILQGTDNEDAWHGHVAGFISLADSPSTPPPSTNGSFETVFIGNPTVTGWRQSMIAGTPTGVPMLNDGIDQPVLGAGLDSGPGGVTNDCGGSPSNAPSPIGAGIPFIGSSKKPSHSGPVFRAPNCANLPPGFACAP